MKLFLLFISVAGVTAFSFSQQPQQLWSNRYNGTGDFSQEFVSVSASRDGGYFAGGHAVRGGKQKDLQLVRFNAKGDTLWSRYMNGSAGKNDGLNDLIVDSLNNIILCGYFTEQNTGKDLVVMKLSSSGALIWKYQFNNESASNDDEAVSLTTDDQGFIYVTGSTDTDPGSKTNLNIITLKLDPDGKVLWTKFYDGSGEFDDVPTGLVANNKGEIFVCGDTYNGSDVDMLTLKYGSNGSLAWMKSHNRGKDDMSSAIAVDKGYVYVAGSSDNGRDNDIVLVKYSFSGSEAWANGVYFNGPALGNDMSTNVITDMAGNVYVCGTSDQDLTAGENLDFCLIKYNINGTAQWTKTWGSSKEQRDIPSFLVFGKDNSLIIGGTSDVSVNKEYPSGDFQAVSYSSLGGLIWEQSYSVSNGYAHCTDGTIDDKGQLVVTGKVRIEDLTDNGVLLQFTSDGKFNFYREIESEGENTDRVHKMIMDPKGNAYLCGYTFDTDGQRDMYIQRADKNGFTNWKLTYNGKGGENDEAMDLCVDASGNTYVTGYSKSKKSEYDITTLKIAPDGLIEWDVHYDFINVRGDDRGAKITMDSEGNIYVAGISDGNAGSKTDYDIVLLKYNPKGIMLWNKRFSGKAAGDESVTGLQCISGNRIILTGNTYNGTDDDMLVHQYNDAGLLVWENYHNSNIGNDRSSGMTIDNGEKITVVGTSFNGKDNDMLTMQYTADGTQNWINQFDGGRNEEGVAVAADGSRNIYVTGTSYGEKNTDVIVLKMSDNGVTNWVDTYNGDDDLNDGASAIQIDKSDFIIVAGYSEVNKDKPQSELLLRKYHPNFGVPVWNKLLDGGEKLNDRAYCLLIDEKNNLYVAGSGTSSKGQEDIVSMKFDSPLNLHEITYPGTGINLFPNPFTDEITIDLFNDKGILSYIDIYTLNGKKVKSFKTTKPEFIVDKKVVKPGVYLYNVTQDSEVVQTGKIILK